MRQSSTIWTEKRLNLGRRTPCKNSNKNISALFMGHINIGIGAQRVSSVCDTFPFEQNTTFGSRNYMLKANTRLVQENNSAKNI